MQTAIPLPDSLLRQADEMASELAIPRSRLIALALEEFICKHRQHEVTERLDAVYRNPQTPRALSTDAGLENLRELTADDSW